MPIDPQRILFLDDHLFAVTKLQGELSVAGSGKMQKLPLLDFLRRDYPGIRPIHRLDFDTSGVLLFARTKNVLDKIIESKFQGWRKTYIALIAGIPSQKNGDIRVPLPAREAEGDVDASTQYKVLQSAQGVSLVEAVIERGQRHQIRKHFAAIGHPLVLDDEYGDEKVNRHFGKKFKYRKFFLHAATVDFPHPVSGKQMHIESPMPRTFEKILQTLGLNT